MNMLCAGPPLPLPRPAAPCARRGRKLYHIRTRIRTPTQVIGSLLPCEDFCAARLACRAWGQALLAAVRKLALRCSSIGYELERVVRLVGALRGASTSLHLELPETVDQAWLSAARQLLRAVAASSAPLQLQAQLSAALQPKEWTAVLELLAAHCNKRLALELKHKPRQQRQEASLALAAALPCLAQLATLSSLSCNVPLAPAQLRALAQLPALRQLHLHHVPLTAAPAPVQSALNILAQLTGLTDLTLPYKHAPCRFSSALDDDGSGDEDFLHGGAAAGGEGGDEPAQAAVVVVPQWPHLTSLRFELVARPEQQQRNVPLLLGQQHSATLRELHLACTVLQVRAAPDAAGTVTAAVHCGGPARPTPPPPLLLPGSPELRPPPPRRWSPAPTAWTSSRGWCCPSSSTCCCRPAPRRPAAAPRCTPTRSWRWRPRASPRPRRARRPQPQPRWRQAAAPRSSARCCWAPGRAGRPPPSRWCSCRSCRRSGSWTTCAWVGAASFSLAPARCSSCATSGPAPAALPCAPPSRLSCRAGPLLMLLLLLLLLLLQAATSLLPARPWSTRTSCC
jgi:hypothetical protein